MKIKKEKWVNNMEKESQRGDKKKEDRKMIGDEEKRKEREQVKSGEER